MRKNQLRPDIRFTGFTTNWELSKLGEVSDIYSGGTPSRGESSYWDGKIPWVTTSEVNYSEITDTKEKITIEGLNNSSAKLMPIGTILLAMYGQGKTRGQLGILAIEAATNQANANIQVHGYIYIYFIYYQLVKKYKLLRGLANEGGQANLSLGIVKSVNVAVTNNLDEQIKIGNFFNQLDKTIKFKQQLLHDHKQLKKAMLQKMFPQKGETKPRVRFAGFFDEWQYCRLGEIGQTYTGLSGKTKEDFGHGEAEFITYVNIFNNQIARINGTEKVEIDYKQHEVRYGDIFFTTSSETPEEVGMSSIWFGDKKNVYLNSFCFGYRPNKKMDLYYLAFMLRSTNIRKKFMFLAQGISRYNISKIKTMEIKIPIPQLEEQQKIGDFFKQLDETIELHQTSLETYQELKKTLLQKMFV